MIVESVPPPEGRTAESRCFGAQLYCLQLSRAAYEAIPESRRPRDLAALWAGLPDDVPACPGGRAFFIVSHPRWFVACPEHGAIQREAERRRLCQAALGELEAGLRHAGAVILPLDDDLQAGALLARIGPAISPLWSRGGCRIAMNRHGDVWCWSHGPAGTANTRSDCYEKQRRFAGALRRRAPGIGLPVVTSATSLDVIDGLVGAAHLPDRLYCFDNGRYRVDAEALVSCSVHGAIEDQSFVDDHGVVIETLVQPPA